MTTPPANRDPSEALLDRALAAERSAPAPSQAEVDRVLAHVTGVLGIAFPASLDAAPTPSDASEPPGAADSSPASQGSPSTHAPRAALQPPIASPLLRALKTWVSSSGLPSLVVGIALGAAGHEVVTRRGSESAPTHQRPVGIARHESRGDAGSAPNAPTELPSPASVAGRDAAAAASGSADPVSTVRAESSDVDDDLDSERRLIDAARAALARGDSAGATRFLDRHAQRYPNGYFAEDRETLRSRVSRRSQGTDENLTIAPTTTTP